MSNNRYVSMGHMTMLNRAAVVAIENKSFNEPWSADDWAEELRNTNVSAYVAYRGDDVVGYIVVQDGDGTLYIDNIAVAQQARRQAVGRQMMTWLKLHAARHKVDEIRVCIRETNLAAQLFFQSAGFAAVGILDEYYDNGETAYVLSYRLLGCEDASWIARVESEVE